MNVYVSGNIANVKDNVDVRYLGTYIEPRINNDELQ